MGYAANTAEQIFVDVESVSAPLPAAHDFEGDFTFSRPSRRALIVGVTLAFFQILDGIFTAIGVSRGGPVVEGNPMLRELMYQFGHIETLTVLKLIAVAMVIILTLATRRLPWITNALTAVAAVYFVGAILPWTYILFVY